MNSAGLPSSDCRNRRDYWLHRRGASRNTSAACPGRGRACGATAPRMTSICSSTGRAITDPDLVERTVVTRPVFGFGGSWAGANKAAARVSSNVIMGSVSPPAIELGDVQGRHHSLRLGPPLRRASCCAASSWVRSAFNSYCRWRSRASTSAARARVSSWSRCSRSSKPASGVASTPRGRWSHEDLGRRRDPGSPACRPTRSRPAHCRPSRAAADRARLTAPPPAPRQPMPTAASATPAGRLRRQTGPAHPHEPPVPVWR